MNLIIMRSHTCKASEVLLQKKMYSTEMMFCKVIEGA